MGGVEWIKNHYNICFSHHFSVIGNIYAEEIPARNILFQGIELVDTIAETRNRTGYEIGGIW